MSPDQTDPASATVQAPLPPLPRDSGPKAPVPGPLDELMNSILRPAEMEVRAIQASVARLAQIGGPMLAAPLAMIQQAISGILPALAMPMMGSGGGPGQGIPAQGMTPPPVPQTPVPMSPGQGPGPMPLGA